MYSSLRRRANHIAQMWKEGTLPTECWSQHSSFVLSLSKASPICDSTSHTILGDSSKKKKKDRLVFTYLPYLPKIWQKLRICHLFKTCLKVISVYLEKLWSKRDA